jgi:hypothetical protein
MEPEQYDPEFDTPMFSQRDVLDLFKRAIRKAAADDDAAFLDAVAAAPLTVHGKWKLDTVYQPQSLVYYDGVQWLSLAQTASAPAPNNPLWRRVNHKHITEES